VTLVLPARLRRVLIAQARAADPEECCGILVGTHEADGEVALVEEVIPTRNAARRRKQRYVVPPEDVAATQRRAREEGRLVVGFYHSHPDDPAMPSAADRKDAWPGVRYLIISLAGLGRPVLRSFRFHGGGAGFSEEPCRDGRSGRRFGA